MKVEENNTLRVELSKAQYSKTDLQERLKVAQDRLSESQAKIKSEIDAKDKEIAKVSDKHSQAQLESSKEIEKVNIIA